MKHPRWWTLSGGGAKALAGVTGGPHAFPPGAVGQIPVDGAAEAGLEIVRRGPAERGLGSGRVDFVAEIMARPVGDEADQSLPRAGRIGHALVEMGADARTTSRLVRGWRAPMA